MENQLSILLGEQRVKVRNSHFSPSPCSPFTLSFSLIYYFETICQCWLANGLGWILLLLFCRKQIIDNSKPNVIREKEGDRETGRRKVHFVFVFFPFSDFQPILPVYRILSSQNPLLCLSVCMCLCVCVSLCECVQILLASPLTLSPTEHPIFSARKFQLPLSHQPGCLVQEAKQACIMRNG